MSKLVVVNSIVPSVPEQVVGFVDIPAVRLGAIGFDKDFKVAAIPVQPERVIEKLL